MSQSFEQYFAQGEENTNLSQKERKNLKLKEKIEEMEDIVTRMEKEGKTIEGYQRISELVQEIEELYEEKERDYEAEFKTIVANLKKALKEGADKDSVAFGLAGVNAEEAEEFRRKHFAHNPTLFAKSYSTDWVIHNGFICRYGYEE